MDKKETNVMSKQKRYSEKETVKRFLVSNKGISFLVDHVNRGSSSESFFHSKKLVEREVSNLIDYYFAWIHGLPVRKSMSKYEFIKYLEDFCRKNDVGNLFEFLFI
ncbi:hypothetical protein EHEL_080370 [Encephalitozoon hellem ATCC 50504]|uniref:Uncharacterized protein n=1 Tax=Encephalitozoon hellem TaxID=27973 RepID=A0A9Q9F8Q0_ENCHE|nr:uncharacterized protein EHEL_080370 [Encephalitozoon hellem ATCC 50504]AFM98742.1 hypothetical protein EHEL_080370 [Encephalitozoon hellem ATCC 50504]UTX43718.1 hypothetical protein GPU96_08g14870 [Encephalitozoon hellem]WEL39194.1 hypothetical protein PFJ87_08g00520 [Encephalitozoon hellem]|eukprot:XP_003887723.1 hypothetical protein EHEL_080370 [Encephalitozoon hellem ATCC 50504]